MKLKHEIRHAAAGLKKTPVFVFTLVFTLALTLGALLAAFNLNQLILFKPLTYPNADQLYVLEQNIIRKGQDNIGNQLIGPQLSMYQKGQEFVTSAPVFRTRGILASAASEPRLLTLYTTNEFFSMLSVPFAFGSGFSPSSEMKTARAEAVISYDTWQRHFGGRDDILGQSLTFNDEQFSIVGVIAAEFTVPEPFSRQSGEIYLPVGYSVLNENDARNNISNLKSLVLLTPEQNVSRVSAQLSEILNDFIEASEVAGLYHNTGLKAHLTPLGESVQGNSSQITLVILAGALVLLLIAFANVVNLYLSHISKKQQLLAICACLGARPKDLFKKLFVESLVLTLGAAVFALVIAAWLLVLTREIASGTLPRLGELGIDLSTVVFSMVIAVMLAAMLAFFGRFAVRYDALKEQLTASGKGTSAQISSKVRHTLIASQISLTGLLILVTSMVLQTSLSTVNHPLGIDIDNVISLEVDPGKNYPSRQQRFTLGQQVTRHFGQLPMIDDVSVISRPPISRGGWGMNIFDQDKHRIDHFQFIRVDDSYFDMMKLRLLHGRNFSAEEITENKNVVLLSQSMATRVFDKVNVVGEFIYSENGTPLQIIGITDNYFAIRNDDDAYFYRPFHAGWKINLMLKVKADVMMSKMAILEQLRTIDPALRIQEFLPLEQSASELLYKHRLAGWLAAGLSLFALILACAGIYGVISYSTQMRRYELGVRMALGAKQKRIIQMVMKDALRPILLGLGASLLLSVVLYGVARNHIVHLGHPDVLQIGSSLIVLMLFSLLACYVPVQSIIKQDPVKALRNE